MLILRSWENNRLHNLKLETMSECARNVKITQMKTLDCLKTIIMDINVFCRRVDYILEILNAKQLRNKTMT